MALGILSVVLVALAGLMFQVSLQTRRSAALSYRSAAAQMAQAYVESLPWDSIPVDSTIGCRSLTSGQWNYTRCLTVQDSLTFRRIMVVLTSSGNLVVPPETLVVDRTKPQLPFPALP